MKNRKETLPTMHRFRITDHCGNVRVLSINEEKRTMVLSCGELRTFSLSYAAGERAEELQAKIRTCPPAMFETVVRRHCGQLAKEITRLGGLPRHQQALGDAIELVKAARVLLDDAACGPETSWAVRGDFGHYVNELGSLLYSDKGEAGMLALLETMKKKGA